MMARRQQQQADQQQQLGQPEEALRNAVDALLADSLGQGHFKKAQETWKLFLDMTQSAHGVHQLVQHALIRHGRRRQLRQEQQQLLEREQLEREDQRQLHGQKQEKYNAEPTPEQLEKEDRARVRIEIEAIWREVQQILQASDFLAHLVVAMLETGYPEDAEFFAKKFTIYGNSFLTPMRTAAEKRGLDFIEQFGQLLEAVYFNVPKKPPKKKKRLNAATAATASTKEEAEEQVVETKVAEDVQQETGGAAVVAVATIDENANDERAADLRALKEANNQQLRLLEEMRKKLTFYELTWIWSPPKVTSPERRKKLAKSLKRWHKIDVQQLDKLSTDFVRLWADSAGAQMNQHSWTRLLNYASRNRLAVPLNSRGAIMFGARGDMTID